MGLFDSLKTYDIILASASPRRRELLAMLDLDFKVRPIVNADESYPSNLSPSEVPLFIARKKSEAFMPEMTSNELVITADTVVVCEDTVLGKPKDKQEACRMLEMLSGRKHAVVTGIAVATRKMQLSAAATTEVEFAELSREVITEYVDRYMPLDKAGAYGIQEWIGAVGIKGISGSFYNVMGLPLHLLTTLLLQIPPLEC